MTTKETTSQLALVEPDSTEAVAAANQILEKHLNSLGSNIADDVAGEAFDWAKDDGDIVLYEQPETAIYFNRVGAMVIRQRGFPEEDSFIFIQPAFVTEFLEQAARKWREQK